MCINFVRVSLTTLSHCVHADEKVPPPNAHYDKTNAPTLRQNRRSIAEDVLFSFVRNTPSANAVEALKNLNCLPKKVVALGNLPDDSLMPPYLPWDNFKTCLLTYYAYYLHFEGLVFTHATARELLIYVFCGTYYFTRKRVLKGGNKEKVTKEMPIIHGLYNKLSQNQTRSLKTIRTKFKTFFTLIAKKPEYKKLLGDKGVGEAPEEYLVAIEEGIRGYSHDPQALTTFATRSAAEYDKVAQWRKRACYECLCRVVENHKACKWFSCTWEYYTWRLDRGITFDKRHWPLCQQSTKFFKGKVPELKEWSMSPSKNKRKTKRKRMDMSLVLSNKRYDAEAGCFVDA